MDSKHNRKMLTESEIKKYFIENCFATEYSIVASDIERETPLMELEQLYKDIQIFLLNT